MARRTRGGRKCLGSRLCAVPYLCRALLKEARGQTRPRHVIRLLGKGCVDEGSLPQLEALIAELETGASLVA